MRIGLITDTHIPTAGPDLWPQVYEALRGVNLIMDAGDLHDTLVLDRLEQLTPLAFNSR
jgi:predicted phosphodiesterase